MKLWGTGAALLLGLFGGTGHAFWEKPKDPPREVIVKYRGDRLSFADSMINTAVGAWTEQRLEASQSRVLSLPPGTDPASAAEFYASLPNVEWAEPNYAVTSFLTPNDPSYSDQWGPVQARFDLAWDTTVGNPNIVIAVLDTGVQLNHPDFGNIFAQGRDFIDGDQLPDDEHGHGTHVTGIIAANQGNGIGVSGVAPGCRILPVRVLGADGAGNTATVAEGIQWATDNGADIINLSLGGPEQSTALGEAVRYATERGVLVVAAAGNSGTNRRTFPAAFPGVLSVAASDEADRQASFSNYGDWVRVAAPGANILSTLHGNRYGRSSGTSMASPFAAGLAGLIWSRQPDLTAAQVRARIEDSCKSVGPWVIRGRIDAQKAVLGDQAFTNFTVSPGNVELVSRGSQRFFIRTSAPVGLSGANYSLSNSHPNLIQVPARARVSAGKDQATFRIFAREVLTETTATVTIRTGEVTKNVQVLLKPSRLRAARITPSELSAGVNARLNVLLDGPAPRGGLTVQIEGEHRELLGLPTSVTFPAGTRSRSIALRIGRIQSSSQSTISVLSNGTTFQAPITLVP